MNNNSTIFISIYVISRRYFLASFNSPDFTTRNCYSDFLPILKWLGRNKVNRAAAYRREFDFHRFAVFTINKPQQPMGRNVPDHHCLNLCSANLRVHYPSTPESALAERTIPSALFFITNRSWYMRFWYRYPSPWICCPGANE